MTDPQPPTPYRSGTVPPADPWFAETLRRIGAGHLVFQRFRLQRELGAGGMAVVWLAQDEKLRRVVALKFLSPQLAQDAEAVEDLKKEVLQGCKLSHDGVVRLYDLHEDAEESRIAISMEYMAGGTLADEKARQPDRCFDVAEPLLGWTARLCEILTYVHRRAGVVHRDLKPRNFLLSLDGDLKIADFGISATLSNTQARLTRHAEVSGTPAYMSPQQAEGRPPVVADDVYGLGATLYELLTSKPPFHSGSPAVILHQLKNEGAPSMMERRAQFGISNRPAIPEFWEETIAACLAKDPAARPRDVAEVQLALRLGLGALPKENREARSPDDATIRATKKAAARAQSPETPEAEAAVMRGGRSPWRRVTPALLAVALCVGLGVFLWRGPRDTSATPSPAISAERKRDDDEQKTRSLERARTILSRESLTEVQAFRAVDLCEEVVSIDPNFRDARALQLKAEAILEALHLDASEADAATKRARWTVVAQLPPAGAFPAIQAHLEPGKAASGSVNDEARIAELLRKIDQARAALARRGEQSDFRLSAAKNDTRLLAEQAVALKDFEALNRADELSRLIDDEQEKVEKAFVAESPALAKTVARFHEALADQSPDWETKASGLKKQIEQALAGFDYHQDEPDYASMYAQIAEARRQHEGKRAAVSPSPVASPAQAASAAPQMGPDLPIVGEQVYKGAIGKFNAVFYLTIAQGRVTGYYLVSAGKVPKLRLEGRNDTPGELVLDEYTPAGKRGEKDELTSHITLKLRKLPTEYRWEGTMRNLPPDSRVFPVSIARPK